MMFDPTRVQAIFFDLDGTLVDTDDVAVARLAGPLSYLLGRRAERFARWFMMTIETPGNAFITLLDWLHLDPYALRIRHALRQRFERTPKVYQLIPGVDALLAELNGRFPLALVTSRSQHSIDAFLAQFPEIAAAMTTTCGIQDSVRIKPHPEPILLAASRVGVPVEACLMVGDTRMDVLAGKRAGAQMVAVLCGYGERRELARAGADLILENTADLGWWLRAEGAADPSGT